MANTGFWSLAVLSLFVEMSILQWFYTSSFPTTPGEDLTGISFFAPALFALYLLGYSKKPSKR